MDDYEHILSYITLGFKQANESEKVDLLLLKGNYYRGNGQLKKAKEYYDQAYQMENTNALILTSQAVILIDLEDYESAITKCNASIALDPNQMEAYYNRGIANEMVRNVDDACNDWERAFILGSQKAIEHLNGPVCNE